MGEVVLVCRAAKNRLKLPCILPTAPGPSSDLCLVLYSDAYWAALIVMFEPPKSPGPYFQVLSVEFALITSENSMHTCRYIGWVCKYNAEDSHSRTVGGLRGENEQ